VLTTIASVKIIFFITYLIEGLGLFAFLVFDECDATNVEKVTPGYKAIVINGAVC
jgi:hypothetical protein